MRSGNGILYKALLKGQFVGQQKTPLGAQATVSYCLPSCLVRVSENYSFYEEAVFV